MDIAVPARLFALPERREFTEDFEGNTLDKPRVTWIMQVILGSDAVKLYSDEDPTLGLNGSREKLAAGNMVDVVAKLRLYPRRSGMGVALEGFAEAGK